MGIEDQTERIGMLCGTHVNEMGHVVDLFMLRGESAVLSCLARADEPLLSGELADRCNLSTGRMANLLRQLEGKGLLSRQHGDDDRRKTYVQLTEAGRVEADMQLQDIFEARKSLLSYLGEQDGNELLRLLERCLDYCSAGAA